MNENPPPFVFTDPTAASQFVSIAQLRNAQDQAQRQQLLAMQKMSQDRQNEQDLRDLQQQQLLNQYQVQMGNMGLQRELQQAQIQGQKDLLERQLGFYEKNPYFGRNMGELGLGVGQMNNSAMSAASSLSNQRRNLKSIYDAKKRAIDDDFAGVGSYLWRYPAHYLFGADTPGQAHQKAKEALDIELQQELNKLDATAAASNARFNPASDSYEPLTISLGANGQAVPLNPNPVTEPAIIPQSQVATPQPQPTPAPAPQPRTIFNAYGDAGANIVNRLGRSMARGPSTAAPATPAPYQPTSRLQIANDLVAGKIDAATAARAYDMIGQ